MKEWIMRWSIYLLVCVIAISYAAFKEVTNYIYLLPFFILCLVLYDWAGLRAKNILDALGGVSE